MTIEDFIHEVNATGAKVALVRVVETEGSTPREVGAAMAVCRDGRTYGTIGGGTFEYEAIAEACQLLAGEVAGPLRRLWHLGPDLGQCCGGRVTTLTERIVPGGAAAAAKALTTPVLLFGAGHVGRAVALALAPLPFRIRWIDPRPEAFPALVVRSATAVVAKDPVEEVGAAAQDSFLLVMTHSHALDFAIIDAALRRDDFDYVGLIGSATKRARFLSRLRDAGLDDAARARLVCPIGLPRLDSKEPAVIAASVAADLLMRRQALLPAAEQASLLSDGSQRTQALFSESME